MTELPGRDDVTWVPTSDGNRIGRRVTEVAGRRVVRLLVPSLGVDKEIGSEDAARIIAMLKAGVTFSEITGVSTFRVDGGDL